MISLRLTVTGITESEGSLMRWSISLYKFLVPALAAVSWCLGPVHALAESLPDITQHAQADGGPSYTEPWQTSWEKFVDEISGLYGRGADDKEFARHFNGRDVMWTGQVIRVVADPDDPALVILMPHYNVVLPDGRVAKMDNEISLHVQGPFKVTGGEDVRFRAKLGNGNKFFPSSVYVLRVKDNDTGLPLTLIKVSLVEGSIE